LLAVDGERGGYLDVGAVEVLQFLLPVLVLELEEDRAENGGLIQARLGVVLDVGGGEVRSGPGGLHAALAEAAFRAAEPAFAEAARSAGVLERLAGGGTFLVIEPAVAVLVEVLDDLAGL